MINITQQKKRDFLHKHKSRYGCGLCGFNRSPVALDLHHVGGEKETRHTDWINLSWENLLIELKKCEVLCRNCHMMLHFDPESL